MHESHIGSSSLAGRLPPPQPGLVQFFLSEEALEIDDSKAVVVKWDSRAACLGTEGGGSGSVQ